MKLINHIRRKKYFYTIYFVTTLATLVLVSIFLWTTYFRVYDDVYKREVNTNIQLLGQLKASINNTTQALEDACFSIYNSNQVQRIMYSNEKMDFDSIKALNSINQTFVQGTPYVHSIYIYNKGLDQYYSTYISMFNLDKDFKDRTKVGQNVVFNFMPAVRRIDGKIIATYSMNDDYYYAKSLQSNAIYINFDFQWINNNIEKLSEFSPDQTLMVFDPNHNIITSTEVLSIEYEALANYIDEDETSTFTLDYGGTNYFVTYMPMKALGWKLVKMEKYDSVFSTLRDIRKTILVMYALAFLSIILVFMIISKRLYKPVEHTLKYIQNKGDKAQLGEFTYIERYYHSMKQEIDQLELQNKENLMRELLKGDKVDMDHKVDINFDESYVVLFLGIDNFPQLQKSFDLDQDQELIQFTLCNIISEVIRNDYSFEYISLTKEQSIVLIQGKSFTPKGLQNLCEKLQRTMKKLFDLSMTIAVSEPNRGVKNLYDGYCQAEEFYERRFYYEEGCLLPYWQLNSEDKICLRDWNRKEEETFFKYLETGEIAKAHSHVEILLSKVRELTTKEYILWSQEFQEKLLSLIYELNEYSEESILDIISLSQGIKLDQVNYLWQAKNQLDTLLTQLYAYEGHVNVKQMKMVKEIKSYILTHYKNPDLGMGDLSEALNKSQSYLGKLFKSYEGITITEYLNEIRLTKSLDWMKNTRLPITSIMEKVGYRNESYYFRLFKKKFNTTPRKYMEEIRGRKG